MKKWRLWCGIFVLILMGKMYGITAQAGSIYTSPYVSFSPDRQAWTTDAGNQNVVWYKADGSDDVVTGVESSLTELQTGEHYYSYERTGTVPIAKWIVRDPKVNCCHNAYPADGEFHGVDFVMQNCYKPHFSGWYPVCADCGRYTSEWNFYMSKNAARSLGYLEYGEHVYYYYLCPFNRNLETGTAMKSHVCREISANRYRVIYDANAGEGLHSGYMAPSFHIYNNAEMYEGKEVTPQKHLNLNSYGRIGWEFAGWNTAADGSGTWYEDGAEILNLCEGDYDQDAVAGTVILYAMWNPSKSVLEIDTNGGGYNGEHGIVEIEGEYGSVLDVEDAYYMDFVWIYFDTCGGESLEPENVYIDFAGWKQSVPFHGKFQDGQYHYCGPDGSRDRITALYESNYTWLPMPKRENYSFAGWFYDAEYTRKAGDAGDSFRTNENITLYAQWAELVLVTEQSNSFSDALDLSWHQEDGRAKSYKLYQCAAGMDWEQIYELEDEAEIMEFNRSFECCEEEERFTVPYTGFYQIEAYGAQGGDYWDYTGGLGGMVKGNFWLEKGQEITVCVGSQYGYNGGGECGLYQVGGGYTSVYVGDELLLIAGGGGGAGEGGNGGAGGMETSLVEEGHVGESGEAGGGGGYLGGRAGEVQRHYHETGVCNHEHEGDSTQEGGCYTQPIKCEQKLKHTHTRTEYWSWGGSDESYCPNCGADASKGEDCIGHETKYYQHDCPVHGKQASNKSASSPSKCSEIAEYGLTCGRTDEYICGYPEDGYIISSLPAYGGSSYINEARATFYTKTPGVRDGDGYVVISSENQGFFTDTELCDVWAYDKAAPYPISAETVSFHPLDATSVKVQWDNPQDRGTVYYHKAESYLLGQTDVLSESNITIDNMVTGVDGYEYLVDCYPYTEVTLANGRFLFASDRPGELLITLAEEKQYLHVAVVDRSNNISETTHIPLGSLQGETSVVKWPVYTEPLIIEPSESVHKEPEENVFYVKCDGKTPFSICFNAYMEGVASEQYQLNYAIVESDGVEGSKVRNVIYIPSCSVTENGKEYSASELRFKSEGEGYLQNGNYFLATRSNRCKELEVSQEYILLESAHGQRIELVPVAGVDADDEVIYSDYEKDKNNGLCIIGDGESPAIEGLEVLEDLQLLDRRNQDVLLQISAKDELSGVKEFYVEIENLDNGAKRTYIPEQDGQIRIDICADETIFSGDIIVTAFATDHVGNRNSLCYGTTEFDLQADIKRLLSPNTPVFKKGEWGCLDISSWGYAERIEVEFPDAFISCNPELNKVYEYELKGAYRQDEQLVFMIPLEVPDSLNYTVTVRAYKGNKMIERYPALAVLGVRGSILDDIRTRLR